MIARHYSSLAEAETKNASSEERLRLFFDRQIVGMAITTSEKHWLQVNDKLCSMLGYTRDELNGLSWADLTHADDLARDVAQFNRLVAGKIDDYSLEKRFIRKDGTIVATNLSVGCVRDAAGNIDYVLALLEDITDRKQVENALRESESLLRTVFDNVPFELWVRNQEGRCIMQNAALTRHWGDLLGLRPEDSPVSPEELALWQDNNRRAFAGEVVKGEVEYCINGEQRLFENVIAPIVIGGEIKSILGFNIDVTDQRKTEEKLCQAVKMESIGRLAGGIPMISTTC